MCAIMVSIANATAHLREIVDLTAAGETVVLTECGKPVMHLQRPTPVRKPINLADMQALTAAMPYQPEDAGEFMRQLRDKARY